MECATNWRVYLRGLGTTAPAIIVAQTSRYPFWRNVCNDQGITHHLALQFGEALSGRSAFACSSETKIGAVTEADNAAIADVSNIAVIVWALTVKCPVVPRFWLSNNQQLLDVNDSTAQRYIH